MYPTLSDLIFDLTGINIPLPIQSFGFMLAISFLCAAWTLSLELKRKEAAGVFLPVKMRHLVGAKATTTELLSSFILGFVIGFKFVYIALNYSEFVGDTQGVLLSSKGSWLAGLLLGAIGSYLKYNEKEKSKLETPEWREEEVPPHQLIGNITMVAAISGLIGAKIFHNLENIDDFIADPWGALISFSGLTMYGGLIVGGAGVIWYANKHNLAVLPFTDSAAPGLMLAYGTGRVGCHLAGDGDWGIVNVNPKPSWLPDWAWGYHYPHNVIGDGIPIPGCVGKHCMMLPAPVYPTPLYEAIICIGLFFVLWSIRKHIKIPGVLFCIYLLLNGVERFLIEKIRVNTKYHIAGHAITQAEIISFCLILLGIAGIYFFTKRYKKAGV